MGPIHQLIFYKSSRFPASSEIHNPPKQGIKNRPIKRLMRKIAGEMRKILL